MTRGLTTLAVLWALILGMLLTSGAVGVVAAALPAIRSVGSSLRAIASS